jgi:hypothetical protein
MTMEAREHLSTASLVVLGSERGARGDPCRDLIREKT